VTILARSQPAALRNLLHCGPVSCSKTNPLHLLLAAGLYAEHNMADVLLNPNFWGPDGSTCQLLRALVERSGGVFETLACPPFVNLVDKITDQTFKTPEIDNIVAFFKKHKQCCFELLLSHVPDYSETKTIEVIDAKGEGYTYETNLLGVREAFFPCMRNPSEKMWDISDEKLARFMYVVAQDKPDPEGILQIMIALDCGGDVLSFDALAKLLNCARRGFEASISALVSSMQEEKFQIYRDFLLRGNHTLNSSQRSTAQVFDPGAVVFDRSIFTITDGIVSFGECKRAASVEFHIKRAERGFNTVFLCAGAPSRLRRKNGHFDTQKGANHPLQPLKSRDQISFRGVLRARHGGVVPQDGDFHRRVRLKYRPFRAPLATIQSLEVPGPFRRYGHNEDGRDRLLRVLRGPAELLKMSAQ